VLALCERTWYPFYTFSFTLKARIIPYARVLFFERTAMDGNADSARRANDGGNIFIVEPSQLVVVRLGSSGKTEQARCGFWSSLLFFPRITLSKH